MYSIGSLAFAVDIFVTHHEKQAYSCTFTVTNHLSRERGVPGRQADGLEGNKLRSSEGSV